MASKYNSTPDTLVTGTSRADSIENSNAKNVTISAGAGNDSIYNRYGYYASINAGTGSDTIYNYGGDDATIDTGAGNDYIDNYNSDFVSIYGGAGKDTIYSGGIDGTINGGAGNDRISLAAAGNLVEYAAGDGNDTIYGFNESDTLTITADSYSTQVSGNDVIVTVGKEKIRLVGAKGKSLNINDEKIQRSLRSPKEPTLSQTILAR